MASLEELQQEMAGFLSMLMKGRELERLIVAIDGLDELHEPVGDGAYDRWNLIAGPWLYGSSWDDPWYTRASLVGVRAGLYRTESFSGGVYAAYRTSYRDLVAGIDGLWDHWPCHLTQVGFDVEQRLESFQSGENRATRASSFGRYVFQYGDSDHTYGPVAHALGLGLRVDTAWLSLVEHTTLPLDMAKTVNSNAPWQFWFGIQHPF